VPTVPAPADAVVDSIGKLLDEMKKLLQITAPDPE
jgi:hypothetical protein